MNNLQRILMEELIKCRDDITYFAKSHIQQTVNDELVQISFSDNQLELLQSYVDNSRHIVNTNDRMELLLVDAVYAIWSILFHKKSIGYATTIREGKQFMSIVRDMLEHIKPIVGHKTKLWNKSTILLESGGSIHVKTLTPGSFRGCTFNIVIYSNVQKRKDEFLELFEYVYPVISSLRGSKFIMNTVGESDIFDGWSTEWTYNKLEAKPWVS